MNYLHIVLRHPKPFLFLIAQVFWCTGWGRLITFPMRSFRLHLHPANLAWQLWLNRYERDDDLDLIRSLLKPGDTMIDVGANIGFTAMEGAHAVGKNGVVHAIEPHPLTHRYLEENLSLNLLSSPQIQHYAVAVAEAPSELGVQFSDGRRDDMNFMLPKDCAHSSVVNTKSITVPVTTLDVLFSDLIHCDLLKIDVEGMELAVLRGASNLLKKTRHIFIEVGEPNSARYGVTAGDLLACLEASGFEVRTVERGKVGDSAVQIEDYRKHMGNWLAFRGESVA